MSAYPAALGFLLDQNVLGNSPPSGGSGNLVALSRPLFFAFLGAYLFILHTTARRFMAGDLNPDAYVYIATRMIISVIVAAMLVLAGNPQAFQINTAGSSYAIFTYIVAFVVGIFPENGLNWLLSFVRRHFKGIGEIDQSYQLQKLAGLNRWHAIRLNVEGIDNVYNLANADIYDLVRKTRFTVQQIFDWVNQSILLIHLRSDEEFKAVQQLGVRGFNDFQTIYRNSETRKTLEHILSVDGINGEQRVRILYASMQQTPSGDPIRLFWRYKSSYLTGAFEYFNRGRVFAELGEFQRAIQQYDLALERSPLDPILMISRGESRRDYAHAVQLTGKQREAENEFQQAISDFTKAIDLDPFSTDALYNRGRTYLLLEKYNQAVEDFNLLLTIINDHVSGLNERAIAYQALGKIDESVQDLTKAASLDKSNVLTYINLANAYRIRGDFKQAEATFEIAIQIDSRRPELYHGRGLLYSAMQHPRYELAYQDFERAIELGAKEPAVVYKDWGVAAYQQRDYTKAIAVLDFAIEANKSYALAFNMRGLAYHAAGQPALGIQDYTDIIEKINREYADAYVNRGIALSDMGNNVEALKDLRRGIDIDPELVIAYVNRGNVYRKMQDYQLALSDFLTAIRIQEKKFEEAPQIYRRSPVPYNNLGDLYVKMGQYHEANDSFSKAIEADPNFAEAYNNRGLARRALELIATAKDDFSQAISLAPQNAIYYYNRGLIHLDLNSYNEAIRDFTLAIERNPKYEEAFLSRAIAYQHLHQQASAMQDISALRQINPDNPQAAQLEAELMQPQ